MRGEFMGVWPDAWREIWLPLIDNEDVPEDTGFTPYLSEGINPETIYRGG
jgi:hypothetical protein